MLKTAILILCFLGVLLGCSTVRADIFAAKNNCATVNCDRISGDFSDFYFEWIAENDQYVALSITSNSGYVTLTNVTTRYRISYRGTTYFDAEGTESGSVSYVTIARTNIPPNGIKEMELYGYQGSATNLARTLAQGSVSITKSLYQDTNSFPFPNTTSLLDYLRIDDAQATYMQISLYDTDENNIVDTSDAFIAYTNSGAGSGVLTGIIDSTTITNTRTGFIVSSHINEGWSDNRYALSNTVEGLSDSIESISNNLDNTISSLSSVSNDVEGIDSSLGNISNSLDSTITALGVVSNTTSSLVSSLGAISNNLDGTIASVGSISNTLDSTIAALGSVSNTVDVLVNETNNYLYHDGRTAWTGSENGGGQWSTNWNSIEAFSLSALDGLYVGTNIQNYPNAGSGDIGNSSWYFKNLYLTGNVYSATANVSAITLSGETITNWDEVQGSAGVWSTNIDGSAWYTNGSVVVGATNVPAAYTTEFYAASVATPELIMPGGTITNLSTNATGNLDMNTYDIVNIGTVKCVRAEVSYPQSWFVVSNSVYFLPGGTTSNMQSLSITPRQTGRYWLHAGHQECTGFGSPGGFTSWVTRAGVAIPGTSYSNDTLSIARYLSFAWDLDVTMTNGITETFGISGSGQSGGTRFRDRMISITWMGE